MGVVGGCDEVGDEPGHQDRVVTVGTEGCPPERAKWSCFSSTSPPEDTLIEDDGGVGGQKSAPQTRLGSEEELKQSGQLEHLAAAFARRDPPMLGVRREVGPLLLVKHYLERLELAQIVERHLPSHGRARLTNAEVVLALIANRPAAPSPLYDVPLIAPACAL